MHIILGIIAALGGVIWAMTRFMGAARDGKVVVDEVRGAIRNTKWSRRVDKRLIENLSDPREAAAILLVQVASYEGAVTQPQQDHLTKLMTEGFQTDRETSEGMLSFARLALGEINDASNSLRKILAPISNVCSSHEKSKLIEMMHDVSTLNGSATDLQNHLISQVKTALLN